MKSHEYPKPMWKAPDGEITYAANAQHVDQLKKEGWQEECIKLKFPMALHAAGNQGITVHDEEQLQQALKNGWSTKPVSEDNPIEAPASFDRPPVPMNPPFYEKQGPSDQSTRGPESKHGKRSGHAVA